jgi:hypothetical protein
MDKIPGLVDTWPASISRLCKRCGSLALPIGPGQYSLLMKCENGHVFTARPGRMEIWYGQRDAMIDFYIRRKNWARDLLKKGGLTEPGQSTLGKFESQKFYIEIGPRKGVRIRLIDEE